MYVPIIQAIDFSEYLLRNICEKGKYKSRYYSYSEKLLYLLFEILIQ